MLFLCLRWLHKSNKNSAVLMRIVFTFIGGTFICFIIALVLENEYLDGLSHLIVAGGSAAIFWLSSIILLLTQPNKTNFEEKLGKMLIMSIVILVPLLIYLLISNASFKIGG